MYDDERFYTSKGLTNRRTKCWSYHYVGGITVYGSYSTILAFRGQDGVTYIRARKYSPTSSKHLGILRRHAIDGRVKDGIDEESFLKLAEEHRVADTWERRL